jgi:hypothetical protein
LRRDERCELGGTVTSPMTFDPSGLSYALPFNIAALALWMFHHPLAELDDRIRERGQSEGEKQKRAKYLAFGLSAHYRLIFELTRLDEAIGIHEDEAHALAAD